MLNILQEVKDYDVITIFRHQLADPDAMGSQMGMRAYLQVAYPQKQIYSIGDSIGSCKRLFPNVDHVSDEVIASSCAIILDTANAERVDDERFKTAQKIIKIDHHIVVDEYAQVSYVDTSASATCEILARMFEASDVQITAEGAKYLYLGILADSISFTTNSTTKQTLLSAAYLVGCGIDVNKIQQERSGIDKEDFYYVSEVRNHVVFQDGVAYAIMYASDYEPFGFDYAQAKEKVFAMSNVNEFETWCLFTEDKSVGDNVFHGSLRSKNTAIDEVANKYNGGGHALACGVKNLSIDDIHNLINDLIDNLRK